MSATVKTILKYLLTLGIGVFLLWYLVSRQSPEEQQNIIRGFQNADYSWIIITIIIALVEKVIRAYRWNLLLEPLSYKPSLKNTFYSVMVAYLANIFAPRMGEVARCAILKKTDDVPINISFGTVVSERVVDLLCLLILIPFSLLLEYQKISELIFQNIEKVQRILTEKSFLLLILGGVFLILVILLFMFRSALKKIKLFGKVREFLLGVWSSVLSIRKIKRIKAFLLSTILIWLCYFFMTYVAFFALDATSGLPLSAGLVILIVGGLGMAAPVQGGIAAYHYIVMETLEEVYSITDGWALSYAFVVHTSQTALSFFVGLICLILVFSFNRKGKLQTENVNL